MQYRREIDGLRSVAVISVIMFHAGSPLFSGGFIGVDIFFVISGYLITSIIIPRIDDNNFSFIEFYERRIRRILPMLFFVMVFCVSMSWFLMIPSEMNNFGKDLVATTAFMSNILFLRQVNYFAESTNLNPLIHTWSLSVEEQYYILFPVLMVYLRSNFRKYSIYIISLIALGSFTAMAVNGPSHPSLAFYSIHSRAWEIFSGSLCAIALHDYQIPKNGVLSFFGLLLIVLSIFLFSDAQAIPSLASVLPVAGAALIILYAAPESCASLILGSRPLVQVGLISYSAYLWHQPLFAFARLNSLGAPSQRTMLLLALLAFILAYLSWLFIEQPFRRRGRAALLDRKWTFLASASTASMIIAIGTTLYLGKGFPSRLTLPPAVVTDLSVREFQGNCIDRPREIIRSPRDWFCEKGSETGTRVIAVYSDSHGLSFLPGLADWAKRNGYRLRFSAVSSCPPLADLDILATDLIARNCDARNKEAFSPEAIKDVSAVILIGRWMLYTNSSINDDYVYVGSHPWDLRDRQSSTQAVFAHLKLTLARFHDRGIPVFLIHQVPVQKVDPWRAYLASERAGSNGAQSILDSLSVARSEYEALYSPLRKEIDRVSRLPGLSASTIDLSDVYCSNRICPIGTEYRSIYMDDNHLSNFGAQRAIGVIARAFSRKADQLRTGPRIPLRSQMLSDASTP